MRQSVSVYFSSAGRRVGLIHCFREAARDLGIDLRVIAGDMAPDYSAACVEADVAIQTPACSAPEFIDAVFDNCVRHEVDLVVPTIDPELLLYSRARPRFEAHHITIGVSDPQVVEIAQDKYLTAKWFSERGFATPATFDLEELSKAPQSAPWPLLLKPKAGSASKGIYVANDWAEVREGDVTSDYVAQALLSGREFTTNIFFDRKGLLRAAVPHVRQEVRGGEVSKGETVNDPQIIAIAERLGQQLKGARGALCFQAIVGANGIPSIFEINARFGGGYPLAHRAGAPFAKWLLAESIGMEVDYAHHWQPGLRMLRYDDAHFIGTCSSNAKDF